MIAERYRVAHSIAPRPAVCWIPIGFASVGCVFLFFEVWTLSAWIADGPSPVTQFEDRSSASWFAARVYEGMAIATALLVFGYLVRRCLREQRLVFDARFCIATGVLFWIDPFVNWAQPLFFWNSHFVNLQNWCGNTPFVVNPDCGRLPEPMIFAPLVYTFGFLPAVMGVNALMRWVKRRRPTISNVGLVLTAAGGVLVFDAALEAPMILLDLFAYPGWPLSVWGDVGVHHRYPLAEIFIMTILFTGLAAIRFFKDDHGRTVVERGFETRSPGVRAGVSVLALIGMSQTLGLIAMTILVLQGPYMDPYPRMPRYLVNDMCDTPGVSGTAYGPCPGSPGYRAPVRHLPTDEP